MRTRPTATTVLALPMTTSTYLAQYRGQRRACPQSVFVVHKELVGKDAEDTGTTASTIAASTAASHKRRHLPPGQATGRSPTTSSGAPQQDLRRIQSKFRLRELQ